MRRAGKRLVKNPAKKQKNLKQTNKQKAPDSKVTHTKFQVGVVIPPAGPPITLPLGWLLPGGQVPKKKELGTFCFLHFSQVQLEPGLEVEGVFWENLDRRVHSNGTIVYKVRCPCLNCGAAPWFCSGGWGG